MPYGALASCFARLTVPTAPFKAWLRVVLTYDSADGLRAFVDGQQVAADASLAGTAPGTITELIVGAAYSYAESPALKVEMDNMMVLGE